MRESVLFVDDEPKVLEAIKRGLRKRFAIHTAVGGAEGLRVISEKGPFSVVVSDMAMPEMNGIEFLSKVRDIAPESSRIMLTGHADLEVAQMAVNQGSIVSFLTKPCSTEVLSEAVEDAARRFRTVTAERDLLHQTEASLVESDERFRSLVEASSEVILSLELNGVISYVSPSGVRLYTHRPTAPTTVYALVDERYHAKLRTHLADAAAGETSSLRYTSDTARGDRWYKASFDPVRDGKGTVQGILVVARDITEQREAEIGLRKQMDRLDALRTIDLAISSSLDIRVTLHIVLEQVARHLSVDAASVLLLTEGSHMLRGAAHRGFESDHMGRVELRVGQGHAGRAALERRTVTVTDFSSDELVSKRSPWLLDEGFKTYLAVPLIAKGHVRGVLEIFHREDIEFEADWTEFLHALAGQAAIAVDNSVLFEQLERSNTELIVAYDSTLQGWSKAMDMKDEETEGHTRRVSEMTVQLAHAAGMTDAEQLHVWRGALLHDIGKMGIPDSILLKAGPLTDEEWEIMRGHPRLAFEMLAPIPYLRPSIEVPYCHHERWDGTGYPRGLKGEEIPVGARLFSVVDVWDALQSDRPYEGAWSMERIKDHLYQMAGSQFDPWAVRIFFEVQGWPWPEDLTHPSPSR